ncbi:MAG TPA: hypothetical protein VMZ03_03985 [Chitinophagaceae bacterium]|nr:hypothetical protein [Chitinophagaceae bacterium]
MQILTEDIISTFYKDLDGLKLVTPVATLVEKMKYSKGQVSDYLSKKKKPSKNFISSFYREFQDSLQIVQREITPSPQNGTGSQPILFDTNVLQYLLREKDATLSKLEAMYNDAKADKDRLFTIVEGYLKDIHANSSGNQVLLLKLIDATHADDKKIMDNLDELLHREKGSSFEEAGNNELAIAAAHANVGKSRKKSAHR